VRDGGQAIATVGAGTRLWDFVQDLHRRYDLTLPVVQEFAEPTLGGMLANRTHGSSLQEGSSSLQDWVEQVTLVEAQGEVRSISGPELDYAGANLGVLGVITELKIRVVPSFKVQSHVWAASDDHLADEVLAIARDHYAASVTWFPGKSHYTVTAFDQVASETPGDAHNGQVEVDAFKRWVMPQLFRVANKVHPLVCYLEQQRFKMKAAGYFTDRFAHRKDDAVGWVHNMVYFPCRDRCPLSRLPYQLEEIAIATADLADFIGDAKALLALDPTCLPLNGIYFRFGKPTRGALSMASERETVYVGIEYLRNPVGNGFPSGYEVIQELEQILLSRYRGRPHPGKNVLPMFDGVGKFYPRLAEFEAFRRSMDPDDRFENASYRRLRDGLKTATRASGCVVSDGCYCKLDLDCPAGLRCVPGLVEPKARVCRKEE
jgi:FAD/FMN-containing dehydrogenase